MVAILSWPQYVKVQTMTIIPGMYCVYSMYIAHTYYKSIRIIQIDYIDYFCIIYSKITLCMYVYMYVIFHACNYMSRSSFCIYSGVPL